MADVPTPAEAYEEFQLACAALDAAERACSEANSQRCAALNRVNRAEKAWDELTKGMKAGAPRDSDWLRVQGTPAPATKEEKP